MISLQERYRPRQGCGALFFYTKRSKTARKLHIRFLTDCIQFKFLFLGGMFAFKQMISLAAAIENIMTLLRKRVNAVK